MAHESARCYSARVRMHISRVLFGRLALIAFPALSFVGCGGNGFTQGSAEPDGSVAEAGADGDIIVGPGSEGGHDAGNDATAHDASPEEDAHADARAEGGEGGGGEGGEPDSSTQPEAGKDAAPDAPGCPTGYLDCGGTCTLDNVTNCGSCGHDCANLPNVTGGVTCSATGVCTFTNVDCATGFAHCTSDPDNGCETNITVSPNCGACGTVCSADAGVPVCNGTACVSGCSGSTPTLCDGTTCVNTTDDPSNCSACGHTCAAGGTESHTTCVNSVCGTACNTGYTNCSGGCVDEQTDPNNCNGCAAPCPVATNGTPQCVAGMCGVSCNAGLTYCKSEAACVNETNDPQNCGGCGTICPAGPAHSTPTCAAPTCGFACMGGYTECDGNSCLANISANGAFVSPLGAGSACTSTQPCPTIAAALATGRSPIYLDHGTYTEQVSITASVDIEGGWAWMQSTGVWSNCNGTSTTSIIVAPASANPEWSTVQITAGTVTLSTLTVKNPTVAVAGQAQSLYGIFATGASTAVTLDDVAISVAQGGSGQQPAAVTTPGMNATGSGCGADDGADGGAGIPGVGTVAGSYGATGFVPATGSPGSPGNPGNDGTLTTPGMESTSNWCKTGTSVPPAKPPCDCGNSAVSTGLVGTAGCAGGGAPGGNGGSGGGASIGIFAWQASVNTTGVTVTTQAGGGGGTGGAGSTTPGSGANGTTGSNGVTYPTGCKTNPAGGCYECTGSIVGLGGVGGPGGNGGLGGQGSGGPGGDSLCYAGTAGAVTGITASNCTVGPGGTGGMPNGVTGRSTVGYP